MKNPQSVSAAEFPPEPAPQVPAAEDEAAQPHAGPDETPPRPPSSAAALVLAVLAIVAALWWGQRFLIPVAAGLLLAMLVAPVVVRGGRLLHSPALAALLVLLAFLSALGLAAALFGGQLARVANRVPEMISLAAQGLSDAEPDAQSLLSRARRALIELDHAAGTWTDPVAVVQTGRKPTRARVTPPPAPATAPAESTAIAVGAGAALQQTAVSGSGVLLHFAGDLAIIVFVAFFLLAGGPALQHRFLDQWGATLHGRARAQRTLMECVRQVRLYAGVLLVTNVLIGIFVWGAFWLGGLPDAGGWAVAAAVLHVVPYAGMVVLTVLGAAEAFLAHGSWPAALAMAALLVLMSTLIGTFVTAWLQGRAAKMNPATLFIGLVFWGALWGVWGLFLGPALVVVLKVVAEHSRDGRRLAQLLQG